MTDAQRMSIAAILLGISVIASRILGYLRDAVIAFQLGVGPETDAYYAAFWLPDLLNYFLAGGALSITFVPIFTRILGKGDADAAWRLFSQIANLSALVLTPFIVLAWIGAPAILPWMYPGFDADQIALTVKLTRIILPGPLFFVLGGLLVATEVAQKRFWAPTLAPLVYNLCIIFGGLWLGPAMGADGFSWGVLAGAFLGPFLIPLWFARRHLRLSLTIDLRSPELRHYFVIALPLMIGVSLLTLDEWFGRYFGSSLDTGAITSLNNARRLMLVPVALIGQAIGQAALPFLSSLASSGRADELNTLWTRTLASAAAIGTLAAIALASVAYHVTELVYERGAFHSEDTARTAILLIVMCPAVLGWALQTIAAQGFYARENTLRPMVVNSCVALTAIPLYAQLSRHFGEIGLAAAGAAGFVLAAIAIIETYRRTYRVDIWRSLLRGCFVGLVAALPGTLCALGVRQLWPSLAGGHGTTLTLAGFTVVGVAYALSAGPILILAGGPVAIAVARRIPVPRLRGWVERRARHGDA